MNDRSYLIVEQNVARRRRRLNALAGAQIGGLITMSGTLAHLVSVYLGLMSLVQPWWALIAINCVGLGIGAKLGQRRPISLQRDLYRLDRAYALGEKLSTIHEIRLRDDRNPYLRLLYQRVGDTDLSPKRALRAGRRQRRGWAALGSVATASIVLMSMWLIGVPPLSISTLFASDGRTGQPVVAAQEAPETRETSTREAGNPTASNDAPGGEGERTADPCDTDGSSSPSLLSRDARENCEEGSRTEGSGASTESTSSSESGSENARMSVQQLRSELQSVQQRAASGNLSTDDARRELEQLAQEARSPSMEELLRQASQSQSLNELQQRLQDALNELDRQAEQAQQGSGQRGLDPDADIQRRPGQRSDENANGSQQGETGDRSQGSGSDSDGDDPELDERTGDGQPQNQPGDGPQRSQSGSGPNEGEDGNGSQNAQQGTTSQPGDQGSPDQGEGDAESGQGEGDEQASSGNQQESRAGDAQSEGASEQGDGPSGTNRNSSSDEGDPSRSDNARPDSQAEGEQEGAGSPGGSSPGTGPGGDNSGQSSDADASSTNNLRIQSPDLPQDVETLRALVTRGVPFDVSGGTASDGAPQLELNPDRVETLLRSRDLPPEVRDLVRAYFLSLAEGE